MFKTSVDNRKLRKSLGPKTLTFSFCSPVSSMLVLISSLSSSVFPSASSSLPWRTNMKETNKSVYCNYLLTKVTKSITSLRGKMLFNGRIHQEGILANSYSPKFDGLKANVSAKERRVDDYRLYLQKHQTETLYCVNCLHSSKKNQTKLTFKISSSVIWLNERDRHA